LAGTDDKVSIEIQARIDTGVVLGNRRQVIAHGVTYVQGGERLDTDTPQASEYSVNQAVNRKTLKMIGYEPIDILA
jgi:hypothetical protein